jgi:hypothetical protein
VIGQGCKSLNETTNAGSNLHTPSLWSKRSLSASFGRTTSLRHCFKTPFRTCSDSWQLFLNSWGHKPHSSIVGTWHPCLLSYRTQEGTNLEHHVGAGTCSANLAMRPAGWSGGKRAKAKATLLKHGWRCPSHLKSNQMPIKAKNIPTPKDSFPPCPSAMTRRGPWYLMSGKSLDRIWAFNIAGVNPACSAPWSSACKFFQLSAKVSARRG